MKRLSMQSVGPVAAVVMIAAALVTPARAQDVDHAFIFVIDGLRASEGWDDPSRANVISLYEQLAPLGSLLTYAEVRDQPETIPSHNAIMSGTYADIANLSPYDGRENFGPRVPTVFEAYRMQRGAPAESCWVVGNTPLIHDAAHSIFPGYGEDYAASRALDYTGATQNQFAWDNIDDIMLDDEVGVMLINLHETDRHAHSGSWVGYTEKTLESSDWIVEFWNALQADPVYQDNTLLIVATDHGRHLEGVFTGWRDHGCSCAGCRQAFIFAIGPGIRQGFETDEAVSTLDIAPTVAHMLGLDFPYHRGRVLTEILVDGDDVVQGPGGLGRFNPAVVGDEELLVRVAELQDPDAADADGAHRVLIELSEDGGETWDDHDTGEDDVLQYSPAAWTDGEVVVVAWLEIEVKGEEWHTRVLRHGAESADWEEVFYEDMEGSSTPVSNLSLRVLDDELALVEMNARHETIRMWSSDDRGLSWSSELVDYEVDRYFPRDVTHIEAGDNLVVAYSAHAEGPPNMGDDNDNTEIYWMVSDDGGDSWSDENRLTDDDEPSITPVLAATPDGVLHLVWADGDDGPFQLFHARSTDDGETFSDPEQLTDAPVGAWEPAAAADGERLYVAWSQFDDVDEASIHVAALQDEELVEERVLGGGTVARTPQLAPLGTCSSLVTWSESDLVSGWELDQAVVITAGHPATAASGALEPAEVEAGEAGVELMLAIALEIGDEDRGVDAIEVTVPAGFTADGTAELDVDGDLVDSTPSGDEDLLRIELDDPVDTDGAVLTLRFGVDVDTSTFDPVAFSATLHRGLESCHTPVDGELLVGAVEASGDDDDSAAADDDDSVVDDDDDGCDCTLESRSAGPTASALTLLVAAGLWRRSRRTRRHDA